MPLIVSGSAFAAYSSFEAVKRSTKSTFAAVATSSIALVYAASRSLFAAPSGRPGCGGSSCAIGENSTKRGAARPLNDRFRHVSSSAA